MTETLDDYRLAGVLSGPQLARLRVGIDLRQRILICGEPGSGRTRFLHAILHDSLVRHPAQSHVLVEVGDREWRMEHPQLRRAASLHAALRDTAPLRVFVDEVGPANAGSLAFAWGSDAESYVALLGRPDDADALPPGGCAAITASGPWDALGILVRLATRAGSAAPGAWLVDLIVVLREADGLPLIDVLSVGKADPGGRLNLESV